MKQRSLPLAKPPPTPRPLPARKAGLELPEDYGDGPEMRPCGEPVPEWLKFPFVDGDAA